MSLSVVRSLRTSNTKLIRRLILTSNGSSKLRNGSNNGMAIIQGSFQRLRKFSGRNIHSANEEKAFLLREARSITLSFWRTCVRCIKLLRKVDCEKPSHQSQFSMMMHDNEELQKKWRSNYYLDWASENIFQESDCLNGEWSQTNIDRYLHFIRQGEQKRQWLLKEFKFEKDPYSFPYDRLLTFEKRAYALLAETNPACVEGSFAPNTEPEEEEVWDEEIDEKSKP
jgi:hypothetical protein